MKFNSVRSGMFTWQSITVVTTDDNKLVVEIRTEFLESPKFHSTVYQATRCVPGG